MNYPDYIQKLIDDFATLPTVGPKTAERYVFYLLKQNPEKLEEFSGNLNNLKSQITTCGSCHAYAEKNPCAICSDPDRNQTLLCIVSNLQDMINIENTGKYSGLYHILGGYIDAIEGINPENLSIKSLKEKLDRGNIQEIVLALNPTLEGETTSKYLIKLIKPYNIKITRLARGLSTGSDLEYVDALTIINALENRNEIK